MSWESPKKPNQQNALSKESRERESIEGRIYLKELDLLAMVAGKPKIYRALSAPLETQRESRFSWKAVC